MSQHDELVRFIEELERWALEFKEKLQHPSFVQSRVEEAEAIRKEVDNLLHQIKEIKERSVPLNASICENLRKQALSLNNLWNKWLNRKNAVPIGKHQLPPLPYAYNALEPVISEEIMRLHHDKHHKSYVDGLNKAELEMQKARETNDFALIKHWEREAAFNGAGHYLHTIFWNIMSPNGGGKPKGELLREIENSFGSFEKFKRHFTEAANKVEGVGWAILVWSPRSHRLEILQAEMHQHLSQWDVIPLLVLDVWEHAYYLQYKNDRKAYIDKWWNVVNWDVVAKRYQKAKQLMWKPY